MGESSQSARSSVDAGDTQRDDRKADDEVHEVAEAGNTTVDSSQDEGRGTLLVRIFGTEETIIPGADQKTDKRKTDDVEAAQVSGEFHFSS